jgi:uncharacterized protein (DUF427 family)
MPQAIWNGAVLAESDRTVVVEDNHYFPPDTLRREYFVPSKDRTFCHWKGVASYYHVQVGDAINENAAWFYPHPKPAAANIQGYVAFWHGVQILSSEGDEQQTASAVPEIQDPVVAEDESVQQPWWRRLVAR